MKPSDFAVSPEEVDDWIAEAKAFGIVPIPKEGQS